MRCDVRRARRIAGRAALLLALVGPAACEPMDTGMQAIFGRSMRSQVSFDPYENPMNPPEGSVSFASGNHPALPGQVNVGQHDLAPDVPPFTADEREKAVAIAAEVPYPRGIS